jgi:hypothetical protein
MKSTLGILEEAQLLHLAREIAADMRELPEILTLLGIEEKQWERIRESRRFQLLLEGAVREWNSVHNTQDRVRLKALAFVEESLPEFYARAHDPKESLSSKTEVLKAISRLAGVTEVNAAGSSGERMVININLGADKHLKIEKNVGPKTIEGEVVHG